MTAIRCNNLSKRYKGQSTYALDNLELIVEENRVFGFLGPNGAGKTTAIRILTGMMTPTSGEAFVAGEKVSLYSQELRKKIGYLGQDPKMYGWMKGLELLLFVGNLFGFSKSDNRKRSFELLELAGLADAADKKLSAYSGGMIQRLGIAQALMGKPKVLFLDEPTSALDPIGRKEVLEFIRQLSRDTTVFLSTHILQDVERVCDEVAIINKGKLVVQDSIRNIMKRYSSRQVEILFETQGGLELFRSASSADTHEMVIDEGLRKVIINSPSTLTARDKAIKIISDNGISIDKLELKEAGLEDVFVKLVT
jgi:ABC-2 type transport system ATP-binding protein